MNQLLDQGIQINKELFMNYQLLIWLLSFGDCHLWHLDIERRVCEFVGEPGAILPRKIFKPGGSP